MSVMRLYALNVKGAVEGAGVERRGSRARRRSERQGWWVRNWWRW